MDVVSIKCPNCGASVLIEPGKTTCFCSSCGEPLAIDDGIKRSINVNVNIDTAQNRKIDIKLMKYNNAVQRLERRKKRTIKFLIGSFLSLIFWYVVVYVASKYTGINLLDKDVKVDNVFLTLIVMFLALSLLVFCGGLLFGISTLISTAEQRDRLDRIK